ncbi:MAG: serine hydrolase [Cyclobacteriaceae bacterium]|nr:serine hydrolase [Cyclobacteriaceae bacterium]
MKYFVTLWFISLSICGFSQSDTLYAERSIVLLKNENSLIPFKHLDSLTIEYSDPLLKTLGERYTQNQGAKKILITDDVKLSGEYDSKVLLLFGSIDAPPSFDIENYEVVVYCNKTDSVSKDLVIQKLFGGRDFTDTLKHAFLGFDSGAGLKCNGSKRFSFGSPKEVGIDSAYLYRKLDSIAMHAIDSGVAPGIQVLVARYGRVVFHKTYGFTRYDSLEPVRKDMLYDFASVTKVTGALPALMKLYDENKFSLDATMGTYLPYFARGNKKDLTYRRVLSHNAGLEAWIPYWKTTLRKNGKYRRHTLSHDSSANFQTRLSPNLYLYNNYRDNIYKQIRKSPIKPSQGYVYSGLSFYLYPEIVEKITGQDYETYIKQNFYKPLGASTITYNPMRFYTVDQMVPTEVDTFFRMEPLWGVVHDEGAAMMKGVSSNAGLFGTTLDLAKLFQMYLWMGHYGGEQYISENTMENFTLCHYCNEGDRRGLGFDKPVLGDRSNGSTAIDASERSFGHSGYTGTFAWADPENGVLFIFMSNRVYPTRNNSKLYQFNVRPTMHQAIYDAIKAYQRQQDMGNCSFLKE